MYYYKVVKIINNDMNYTYDVEPEFQNFVIATTIQRTHCFEKIVTWTLAVLRAYTKSKKVFHQLEFQELDRELETLVHSFSTYTVKLRFEAVAPKDITPNILVISYSSFPF